MPDSERYHLVDSRVSDGDTLRVRRGDEQCTELRLRPCGIDAPEKDQAVRESRDPLRALIGQGEADGGLIVLPVEVTSTVGG